MKFVLDPSAIMNITYLNENLEVYIPEPALKEIKDKTNILKLQKIKFHILNPKKKTIKEISDFLSKYMPLELLSKTDLEILALAKELNAKIFTEDFMIQNACFFLKIEFENFSNKRIKYAYIYRKFCENCKKYYKNSKDTCPICGKKLEIKIVRKIKI